MTGTSEQLLLFGASGAIGGAILGAAVARGWQVTAARQARARLVLARDPYRRRGTDV